MTNHDRLNELIEDIGKRNNLALTLDVRGSCAIQYDDIFEVIVTACDRGESVLLHSPLFFLDEKDPLTQLRRCMEFSAYGAETANSAISLDPDGDVIVFWRRMSIAGIDSHALEKAIIAFTTAADKTRTQLTHAHEDAADDEPAGDAFSHHAAHIRI